MQELQTIIPKIQCFKMNGCCPIKEDIGNVVERQMQFLDFCTRIERRCRAIALHKSTAVWFQSQLVVGKLCNSEVLERSQPMWMNNF